jgi:hypothetical protein
MGSPLFLPALRPARRWQPAVGFPRSDRDVTFAVGEERVADEDLLLRRLIAALCLVLTVAAGGRAWAADQVEDLMKRGTELRRSGRDVEALAEFQKALQLRASPRAAAQVALAEQALGLWVEANSHLEQALAGGTDPWIKKNRGTLETARATIQAHLCRVEFWGAPAGTEILVDGKRVGTLPNVQTWAAPGEISFEARQPGFTAFRRTMKTPEGGVLREHVQLRPSPAEATPQNLSSVSPATPLPVATAPLPAAVAPAEPTTLVAKPADPAPATSEARLTERWWFWTLVGVGVVAGGATAGYLLTHKSSSCDREPCSTWN